VTTTGECIRAEDISVSFQGVHALTDVTISLAKGEILGLIGPNGAGKTTLINVLTGYQKPTTGHVMIDGSDVTRTAPPRRARLGLVRTFQAVRLFDNLSVLDNVALGACTRGMGIRRARAESMRMLTANDLDRYAYSLAGAIPFGVGQRVGLLRALATGPRYLLLDEPAAGLNDVETDTLIETLRSIPLAYGVGILVVEHDMKLIVGACERIHVLDQGSTIAEGEPERVWADPKVREAYYGGAEGAGADVVGG